MQEQEQPMSTIKDVARRTGLSLSTISKYLNGGNVREENRLAIDAAVAELGYSVNVFARSLKANRSMTVGVLLAMNASSAAMTSIGIRNSVSWISLRAIM